MLSLRISVLNRLTYAAAGRQADTLKTGYPGSNHSGKHEGTEHWHNMTQQKGAD